MKNNCPSVSSNSDVDRWLADAGFRFNPFTYLDAGADPYLGAYLVEHQAFLALWGDWPTLVFAPAGGGKTALRALVARACWLGPHIGHPFPISYIPQIDGSGRLPVTLAQHCEAILQVAACQLLVALLLRPHWWGALDRPARRLMRGFLDRDLPVSLVHYLAQLEDPAALTTLASSHDRSGIRHDIPPQDKWQAVCGALASTPASPLPGDPVTRLSDVVRMVITELKLSSVYLLVDGIDGFPETANSATNALALIQPLLDQTVGWAQQGLFLKGFLPAEMAVTTNLSVFRNTYIRWSVPLLAEVIRRRVFVATEGTLGSLDALGTLELADVETQLARAAAPLPREVLLLTGRLLWEHVSRTGPTDRLDSADLAAAIAWYENQQPDVYVKATL